MGRNLLLAALSALLASSSSAATAESLSPSKPGTGTGTGPPPLRPSAVRTVAVPSKSVDVDALFANRGGDEATADGVVFDASSTALAGLVWLGASTAWGSVGMLAAALLPGESKHYGRVLVASAATLVLGLPTEIATSSALASLAAASASGSYARITKAVQRRVQTLSEALQALTMISLSTLTFSIAQLKTDDVATLALAAAPGAVLGAVALAHWGRRPAAVHLWVPFLTVLGSVHASVYDFMTSSAFSNNSYGFLISVWSTVAGAFAVSVLNLLHRKAARVIASRGASAPPPTVDGILRRFYDFVLALPGLEGVAWIAVMTNVLWVASALFWWSFHSIRIRWGLGLVSVVVGSVEICGAKAADVGGDGAVDGRQGIVVERCRRLGRFTAAASESLGQWAAMQATWRAFWFDPPRNIEGVAKCVGLAASACRRVDACEWTGRDWSGKCGAIPLSEATADAVADSLVPGSRLQRQFISILLTYGSFAIAGAVRGKYIRSLLSTLGLALVVLRTLYVSVFYSEPVLMAGVVGITFGVSLVMLTLGLPQLLDESSVVGKHAKGLMWEVADLSDSLFSKSTTDGIKNVAGKTAQLGGLLLLVGAFTVAFPIIMFMGWLWGYLYASF